MTSPDIAYLSSEYPAVSHTFIFHEIRLLRQNGITIATFSVNRPHRPDVMSHDERLDAAQTVYLKTKNLLRVLGAQWRVLRSAPSGWLRMLKAALGLVVSGPRSPFLAAAYFAEAVLLIDGMTSAGVEHVHVHFANPAATVAMLASRSGRISYSMSVHGPDSFFNVERDLIADKVRHAVFVRCISHFCRSQLMRLLPHEVWPKLHIVRCGIDTDAFPPVPPRNPENVPTLLCVGRLTPAKGQHLLIQAVADLVAAGRTVRLLLVGDGPDRSSLERLTDDTGMRDHVRFTGAVSLDTVQQYYREADIFVLPSFAEGVPMVLMEAMCMELAVVSTRIAGIPELIEHGTNGLLTAAGDQAGLTEALRTLLDAPGLRREFGSRGRATVQQHYNLSTNCLGLRDLFLTYQEHRHAAR